MASGKFDGPDRHIMSSSQDRLNDAVENVLNKINKDEELRKENLKIEKEREKTRYRESVEQHIIDINNKLVALCSFIKLDIEEISHIPRDKEIRDIRRAQKKETELIRAKYVSDEEKRAIVAAILEDERLDKAAEIKEAAMKAAGITDDEFNKISQEKRFKIVKAKRELAEKAREIEESTGQTPPKTDWKRFGLDKSEQQKIVNSIKANPKSNVFSKDFQWNPEEFLGAFKHLENSEIYNGPFIAAVVTDKTELEKYSKIENISEGIHNIYFGKYVLLSVYDITASNLNPKEAKYMYIGLEYMSMVGRLMFKALGSIDGEIKNSQRQLVKEFLEDMDIIYDVGHEDLKNIL